MLDAVADDGLLHDRLRRAETIGWPLASAAFLEKLDWPPDRAGRADQSRSWWMAIGIKCTVTEMGVTVIWN